MTIKMLAITDSDIELFGKDWYSELIQLGIDLYFQEQFQILPITSNGDFMVFVPVRMNEQDYGVFFKINDLVEYEVTGDMRCFFRQPRVVFLEDTK